jgi:transcription initiation factor TFIID subunit 6
VLFGAICGVAASGGPEAVRVLVLPNMKSFDAAVLQPLREKGEAHALELEMLVGGIMKAVESLVGGSGIPVTNGVNGVDLTREGEQVTEFLGPIVGQRVARLGNHALNRAILEVRHLD